MELFSCRDAKKVKQARSLLILTCYFILVRREGVEPATLGLKVPCSTD